MAKENSESIGQYTSQGFDESIRLQNLYRSTRNLLKINNRPTKSVSYDDLTENDLVRIDDKNYVKIIIGQDGIKKGLCITGEKFGNVIDINQSTNFDRLEFIQIYRHDVLLETAI